MPVTVYLWNRAPFVRLLISLMTGIILQWHVQFSLNILLLCLFVCSVPIAIYVFLPLKFKYKWTSVNGFILNVLLITFGALLIPLKDIRNNEDWIGHHYKNGSYIIVTLQEPLVQKANSYKALSQVEYVYKNGNCEKQKGRILLYFKKDSSVVQLHYGSQIVFNAALQEIKNAGNPGSFDFKRYSLFQGITHQAYLTQNDFEILPRENKAFLQTFIFKCREWVLTVLKNFIQGEKEQGLAEALLIGYKDDLDKNLIQSYTNTGVVHIIAISGMHLALIYALLLLLTKPIKRKKELRWLRIAIIIGCLWLFSIMAGAQASVIRSAVMFTCIALGEGFERRTSIFNTLALSAFLLLCFNPFWLWDVGFQLSYAAVLSIVIFYKPISNWIVFDNKVMSFIWNTVAISLAAQILTTPVSLYHFHQFPVLFLLTNVLAVPLSSLILYTEIALCLFSFIKPVAATIGWLSEGLIHVMNGYIQRLENISFALWNGFSISMVQTIFLLITISALCYWMMEKERRLFWIALYSLLIFVSIRSFDFWKVYHQNKLIVYNVPKRQAIDFISGRSYNFVGDTDLLCDNFLRNFHLKPSRILHRIEQRQTISIHTKHFDFNKRHVSIIDSTITFLPQQPKQTIDVFILSKNPRLYISTLLKSFFIGQIVIDSSVPPWKAKLWKHDCDSLGIPCYNVSEKGAFVMNL